MTDEKNLNLPAAKLPVYKEPADFRSSMHWRVFKVMAEFIEGWEFIADFRKSVTIFGSTRIKEEDYWYGEARKLGEMLAGAGFAVATGGGPGIMEAANRGAADKNGDSVGLNIQLPYEQQRINPYVNKGKGFYYFFTRKLMLSFSAEAYVYFPGGFGTLDEFFEIITLIQTKKISSKIPLVLVGKDFWQPLCDWINKVMREKYNAIDSQDIQIYQLVDSAEAAFELIKDAPTRDEF